MHKNVKQFKNKSLAFTRKNQTNPWYYEMEKFSYNFRITDIQSALGNSQLAKLDLFTKKRKKLPTFIKMNFQKYLYISTKTNMYVKHAYHLYTLLIDFKSLKTNRHDFMIKLKNYNIGSQVLYIPLYHQPYYKNKYKYKPVDFPNSETFYEKCLSIPIYPSMKLVMLKKLQYS